MSKAEKFFLLLREIEAQVGAMKSAKVPEEFFKPSVLPELDSLWHVWKPHTSPSESVVIVIPRDRNLTEKKARAWGRRMHRGLIAKSKVHYSVVHLHDAKWYVVYGEGRKLRVEL